MIEDYKFCVVGAGLSGCVYAERIASQLGEKVLVIERRGKIGGNSSATIDAATGIEVHDYGSHIFHTSDARVWSYISKFTTLNNYRHRVLFTAPNGHVFFMPVNLKTIQEFTSKPMSPSEAIKWVQSVCTLNAQPLNLEDKAASMIGRPLYETFIKGYTEKQWGRPPRELPPEIITRLPVRYTYNTDYFNATWQGCPSDGYQCMFEKLLSHPNITVLLNTDFSLLKALLPKECTVIYTGMLDEYFDFKFGHLEWRSLRFENERLDIEDFQGTSVMNYGDVSIPYTRIHEYKHYHPEWKDAFSCHRTLICREYPQEWKPGLEAYYPVNAVGDKELLSKYEHLAEDEKNTVFCGRLAKYKYWDMDKTIAAALDGFENLILKH